MKIKIKWLFFLVCLLLLSNLTVLFAQNTNLAPPAMVVPQEIEKQVKDALRTGSVTLNFENLDVKILAKIISEITGKNIIVDDRVKGDVTIFSSTPVSINEAWNIFIAAVKAKGFEVVQLKKYTKILPEIKNKDFKLSKDYISSPGEELVIAIAILKNANAVELQKSLMALISSTGGSISAYQPNNTIIIVDNSSNIKKLISIIKQMDVVPKQQALRVYNPRYINVTMLTASLEKILRDPDIRFSAYEQTNSMLAYIPQNKVRSVEEIIRNLDRPSFTKERTMRIYYLQNASCEDLVKTLSLMLKEKERVEIKETSPGGVQTASVTDKKSVFSTNLSADKATNSIIMYVTDEEYAELKKIISYLDVQRKQILISAVIAEVSLTKLLNVGVRWQALVDKFAGGYQGGLTQEQLYGVLASGNFILGGVGQSTTTITINGQQVTVPNVFALISLLQSDSDFNLLSCPRVVTLDHKEARLIVGKVIPFATGVKFDSLNNPIITYDYKDVGLDLKITPHINQSEKINLEVNQKIQEVIDYLRPNAGNLSYVVPITSQREFQTSVTVNENQTIVIGGLVTRKTLDNIKKLPILGDLPIFGQAFRDSSKTGEKIILFAFITPHIVNSQEQIDNVTQQYQKAIKESVFIDKKEPLDIIPKDDILSDDKTKNLP